MSKREVKSSKILDGELLITDSIVTKPKKHPKIKQKIVRYSSMEEENNVYVSQLQELARYFSSIENTKIRQYGINLMRELSKCESEEKARAYVLEMMG